MSAPRYQLVLETSSRSGSIALGCGDTLVQAVALPKPRRHRVDLMPTIEALCRDHGVQPQAIDEVYVSVGPGSFTGLRIAIATAKMLAHVLGCRIVAVPTLDVVARNAPPTLPVGDVLGVCLNEKRDTVYSTVYRHDGNGWIAQAEPAVRSLAELVELGAATLLGDHLPELPAGVVALDAALASPDVNKTWAVGRDLSRRQSFIEPQALLPIYARPPEAVELWKQRAKSGL